MSMVELSESEQQLLISTIESQIELIGDYIAEWGEDPEMKSWVNRQENDRSTLRSILSKLGSIEATYD